jgi:hypothetical protein
MSLEVVEGDQLMKTLTFCIDVQFVEAYSHGVVSLQRTG